MFTVGDWIIEKDTKKMGYIQKIKKDDVFDDIIIYAVYFFRNKSFRWLDKDEIELAPLDIRKEDVIAMQHMAVEMNDREWFESLKVRLGGLQVDKIRKC